VNLRERSPAPWAFLVVAAALILTVWLSSEHLTHREQGLQPRATTLRHGDDVLGPWLYWDTKYYVDIAEHGYTEADVEVFRSGGETTVAFFPLYPAAVRSVAVVVGETGPALQLVTFACGLALSVVLYGWFRARVGRSAAGWALAAILLFPWSFFLVAAGYPEALFLLLAVSAFVLVERDRPLLAGVVGTFAALTRVVGVGVVVGLAVRIVERRGALSFDGWRPRLDRTRLQRGDWGVLLAGSGLAIWMAFCWVRYGDPLAFSTAQRGWSQGFGPRSWFKLGLIDQLGNNADRFFVLRLLLQGAVLLLFCAAIPAVWRRFGAGYGSYTLMVLALPMLGSANFASSGRFVVMAFPTFALIGERLADQPARAARLALGASGVLLLIVTSFWGRGYWMA
jgi:hypothetical protein